MQSYKEGYELMSRQECTDIDIYLSIHTPYSPLIYELCPES